jgi:hypothetical protein
MECSGKREREQAVPHTWSGGAGPLLGRSLTSLTLLGRSLARCAGTVRRYLAPWIGRLAASNSFI